MILPKTVEAFNPGLLDVGCTVYAYNPASGRFDTPLGARQHPAGEVGVGSGVYGKGILIPDGTSGAVLLVWDSGEAAPQKATEEVNLSPSAWYSSATTGPFWTDVAGFLRNTLSVTADQLPDARIDSEFASWLRLLQARYPCIGAYAALVGTDQQFLDEAIGFFAAVALWPAKFGNTSGALEELRIGSMVFKYGADSRDERQAWTDRGAAALSKVSCLAAQRKAAAAKVSLFAVAGKARRVPTAIGCGSLDEALYLLEQRLAMPFWARPA